MAVIFEGFSIREYTSKVRSVNVAKCWPFDDVNKASTSSTAKRTDVEMNKLLPPLTCRKYRWWSNEVKLLNGEESVQPPSDDKFQSGFHDDKDSGFGFDGDGDDDKKNDKKEKEEEVVLTRKEKEEQKMVMVCPVCQKFTASTVNAVNIHIDSCLSKASKREKKLIRLAKKIAAEAEAAKSSSKTKKKKRSIVEIFAVAPQIETLQIQEEEEEGYKQEEDNTDDNEEDEVEVGECTNNKKLLKGKKKKKKKLSSSPKADATMGMIRNFKFDNKKKKKKKKTDCSTVTSTSLSPKLFKKKKNKIKKKSKVPVLNQVLEQEIFKHQQGKLPLLPIHSILKNQRSVVSCQKSSSIGNLQDCDCTNFRCVRRSNKHVWFSGKDDILGPTNGGVSSFQLPQIHSIHGQVPYDVMGNALVRQNEVSAADEAPVANGGDAGVICITNASGTRSIHEKDDLDDPTGYDSPSTFLSLSSISCQDNKKGFLVDALDETQGNCPHPDDSRLFHHGSSPAFYNLLSADMPRFVTSALNDGYASNLDCRRDGDVQGLVDMSGPLPDHFVNSVAQSVSKSSLLNMKTTTQPSSTFLTLTTESSGIKPSLPQNSGLTSNGNTTDNSTLHHLSPKDLMSCLSSSIEWKKRRGSLCGGKHIDENFIGLPLNSQGAYVQSSSSSSKVGYNCLDKQDKMVGSSSGFQTHNVWPNIEKQYVERQASRGHLQLFPEEICFRDNPKVDVPSSFGVTQCNGGTETHWEDSFRSTSESVRQLDSELSMLKLCSYGSCDRSGSTVNQTENQKSRAEKSPECGLLPQNQLTIRLMGKDVTIGRANVQVCSFEDEGLWTDKEIITEHHLPMAAPEGSSFHGHSCPKWIEHSVLQKPNETASHLWKAQTSSPQILQMKAVEPSFSQLYYKWRTPYLSHAGVSLISKKQCLETRKVASDSSMDRAAKVPASSTAQDESRYTGREMPVQSSAPHNACDHTLFSSTQFKHSQSTSVHEKHSRFVFPFSSEDLPEYVQPSRFESSSQQLPQWLINPKQQKVTPPALSKPYFAARATHHPSSKLGISSPHKKSTVPLASEPGTSIHRMQKSAGGTSLNFPPIIPAPPGFRRCFPSNSFSKKLFKIKDGSYSRISSLNNIDQVKKTNKRPAATSNDLSRSFKRLNWQMQEFDGKLGLDRAADSRVHTQPNSSPPEHDEYRNEGSDVGGDSHGLSQDIHEEDGFRTLPSSNFCKSDTMGRSGPIKLTAGAKHILKPSPTIARDIPKPTHPIIPLGQVANASKVSELQKKPVQIFKL
ncbi:hypothetical protein C5167_008901 [Papaver somniferum]|uniref:UBZ4-type domain-containing protein n=1 Tax=Papaver somniferum TaxID=3469 RepID=A0A4Y7JYY5_PAPSO|nr:uncharacterized protein LOC113287472 [Papaver somniferum]RZC65211.1 hypothetical protein C5167_008901 [Papaver somniferum]